MNFSMSNIIFCGICVLIMPFAYLFSSDFCTRSNLIFVNMEITSNDAMCICGVYVPSFNISFRSKEFLVSYVLGCNALVRIVFKVLAMR